MQTSFGQFIKQRRFINGITLRQFSRNHGLDPGYVSKLERGRLGPPQAKLKLEAYADYLGIRRGSDCWVEFFDLAAVDSGRLPVSVLNDKALIRKLPVIIRTIHGKRLTAKKLDALVKLIRDA